MLNGSIVAVLLLTFGQSLLFKYAIVIYYTTIKKRVSSLCLGVLNPLPTKIVLRPSFGIDGYAFRLL